MLSNPLNRLPILSCVRGSNFLAYIICYTSLEIGKIICICMCGEKAKFLGCFRASSNLRLVRQKTSHQKFFFFSPSSFFCFILNSSLCHPSLPGECFLINSENCAGEVKLFMCGSDVEALLFWGKGRG